MKNYFYSILFLFFSGFVIAQPSTEVYVMDLKFDYNIFEISNFENISNNKGYDNQPSFYSNDIIAYARNNEKATDIALYSLSGKEIIWQNNQTNGGEYSPTKIPNSKHIAAVRLDSSGLQRLYKYHYKTKESSLLINDLQVAYYAFYNHKTLVASVLSGSNLDLVVSNFTKNKVDTILTKVGRSIHKVPNTKNTMSYTVVNEEKNMDIYQLDMDSLESFFVAQLPIGIQDHIWLDEATMLIGSNDKLYLLDLFGNGDWKLVADLSNHHIKEISRLAISPDKSKLAIVAEIIK